jgi:hypothetical protein
VRALLFSIVLACTVCPVAAADWDHDANIEAAVLEAAATYRLAGLAGLERLVEACYDQLDEKPDVDERLRQFEYCAGMDFAALQLDRDSTASDAPDPAGNYFSMERLMGRVGRLASFIDDANVGNQVIRAWAQTVSAVLERHGH